MGFINKKSNELFNVFVILTLIVFVLRSSLYSKTDSILLILLNLVLFVISVLLFALNYKKTKDFKLSRSVRDNYIAFFYFFLRFLAFVIKGFDLNILNYIFVEFFLLVIVFKGFTLNGNSPRESILKPCFYILAIVAMFFFGRFCIHLALAEGRTAALTSSLTFNMFGTSYVVNKNASSMVIVFASVLGLSFVDTKIYKEYNVVFVFVFLYLLVTNCRTAALAFAVIMVFYVEKRFRNTRANKLLATMLICSCLYTLFITCTILMNQNNTQFTKLENTINKYSTNRYVIEKYTVMSLKNDYLLGFGSYKYTGEKRYQWLMKNKPELVDKSKGATEENYDRFRHRNSHNALLDFICSNGLLCLFLYIAFFVVQFSKIEEKYVRKYYLSVVYILITCNFENLLLNVIPFMYFMLILISKSMESDQIEDKKRMQKKLEEAI